MRRCLAIGLVCAACGDNLRVVDEVFTEVSGSRLALHKYRYDDGTEHVAADEFYDAQLHVRCRPRAWIDGAARCVPVADDAVYADPACTTLVGLGRTIVRPTHFIAYETRAERAIPARAFRAGAEAADIAEYYAIVDGACVGPTGVPPDLTSFFEVGDEIDGSALVEFHEGEVGDSRLGLRIRETDDGLRAPIGLFDRMLDVACVPRLQGDGSFRCEPSDAATAIYFGDPGCNEPVVAVTAEEVPRLAKVLGPVGCASYHIVGRELSAPVYQREGEACTAVGTPLEGRLFSVEPAIELPVLERSLEGIPDRRLQRVLLDHDGLRFFEDRLFDTSTGAPCSGRAFRGDIRCLPASIASTGVFVNGCSVPMRVAEVPQLACERIRFATTNRPFQLHEIGDVFADPMFRSDGPACRSYTSSPGMEPRVLGPPLDLTTFMPGIYFSER